MCYHLVTLVCWLRAKPAGSFLQRICCYCTCVQPWVGSKRCHRSSTFLCGSLAVPSSQVLSKAAGQILREDCVDGNVFQSFPSCNGSFKQWQWSRLTGWLLHCGTRNEGSAWGLWYGCSLCLHPIAPLSVLWLALPSECGWDFAAVDFPCLQSPKAQCIQGRGLCARTVVYIFSWVQGNVWLFLQEQVCMM